MILDASAFRALVRTGGATSSVAVDGRPLQVCRLVFDPDEDILGVFGDLSAFGRSVAAGMRRGLGPPDAEATLRAARRMVDDGDVEIVDMTEGELRLCSVVAFDAKKHRALGIAGSAAATIAIARCRSWTVVSADSDVLAFMTASDAPVTAFPT